MFCVATGAGVENLPSRSAAEDSARAGCPRPCSAPTSSATARPAPDWHPMGSVAIGHPAETSPTPRSDRDPDQYLVTPLSACMPTQPGCFGVPAEVRTSGPVRGDARVPGSTPDAMRRSCEPGHFTASALVIDPSRTPYCLTLHPRVGGGSSWGALRGRLVLADAALREAVEEGGIDDLKLDPVPVHLAVQPSRARSGSTRHLTCGMSRSRRRAPSRR